jgi:flap endonuclease-1
MVRDGVAYASVSQDYDSLLFGSPVLVRNLSITGKRKVPRQDRYVMVEPEEIRLDETLRATGISREQLVLMGLLVGTDFNSGVHGIGPKKALKMVLEFETLDKVRAQVKLKHNAELPDDIEEIYEFFLKPPSVKTGKPEFGKVDTEAVEKILVSEHDFAPERIKNTLQNISQAVKEKGAQKRLGDWA